MKCSECRWFDDSHIRLNEVPGAFGYCRKHKPFVKARNGKFYGEWPLVDVNDYCGEFRKKE